MESVLSQIHTANMKAMLIYRMNFILLSFCSFALLLLIIAWSIEWSKEGGGFLSRYVVCFFGVACLVITSIFSFMVHRSQPKLTLFYGHEIFAIVTLFVTAAAMGTNDVFVNLCNCKQQAPNTQCGAHVVELLGDLIICLSMIAAYLTTQQRIVTFIDKGILDGIKGRSTGMTELP